MKELSWKAPLDNFLARAQLWGRLGAGLAAFAPCWQTTRSFGVDLRGAVRGLVRRRDRLGEAGVFSADTRSLRLDELWLPEGVDEAIFFPSP
eukprot:2995588-Pyramimonas_sp.AAC.1